MTTLSILGCGWLGLPLGQFLSPKYKLVRGSVRRHEALEALRQASIEPHQLQLGHHDTHWNEFLRSDILIVAVPHKVLKDFRWLCEQITEVQVLKHVLFVSSTSVYASGPADSHQNFPVHNERSQALIPASPLLAIEQELFNNPNFTSSVVRLGGLLGPGRHPARFFQGGRLLANPDTPVNLIHQRDCLELIHAILEQQAWGEIFNGCGDEHPSRRDFYSRAVRAYGTFPPQAAEGGIAQGKIISNAKAKEVLGLSFEHSDLLNDALFATC